MTGGKVAREVYYRGRVQGVGFRYNAKRIAQRFDVVGFVRNLDDGRVHLLAIGSADEVTRFLAAVADSMAGNIVEAAVTDVDHTGHYDSFEITV